MMKKLTDEEIDQFVERPNVKKIEAENFLISMNIGSGVLGTIENLVDDAKTKNWNNETIEAILDGILTSGGLGINDLFPERKIVGNKSNI